MKKYLIIIVSIGAISLVGIIYIQVSWLKINISRENLFLNQKAIKILRTVGEQLLDKIEEKENSYFLNSKISDNIDFDINQLSSSNRFFISELITAENVTNSNELKKIFNKEIHAQGFKEIKLHFGIVKNDITIIHSETDANIFLNLLKDTLQNKIFAYPLSNKTSVSLLQNFNDIEVLYLILEESNAYILKKLSLSIGLMLLFTFMVIVAIYIAVSFILKQEQIEIMKTTFIDNMTHEFKTPISTISIALASLRNKKILTNVEKASYFIEIIKEENQRMLEMVELILKNAIVSKGELRLDMTNISLHELLETIINKHNLLLTEKDTDLQESLTAQQDIILADKMQLRIAISNIIENAIKYSKPNIPLKLKIETYNEQNKIILKITDNGIGIKKDAQKHIFNKFYRVQTNNLHNVKGYGLGLSYTHAIIFAHKGSINLKSNINVSSTFIIELPLFNNKTNTPIIT